MKTTPLQHEIDGLIVENDLDGLTEMLELYEDDDELRYLLYEAIDIVTDNLKLRLPLECDIYNLDAGRSAKEMNHTRPMSETESLECRLAVLVDRKAPAGLQDMKVLLVAYQGSPLHEEMIQIAMTTLTGLVARTERSARCVS
jgi:hypothetical protein